MKSWSTNKLEEVSFDNVLSAFDKEHDSGKGTNGWARNALIEANKKFYGRWGFYALSKDDVSRVILPHHTSEGGASELVPRTGLTVEEAVQKIRSTSDYRSKNTECWEKIEYLRLTSINPVFLSVASLDWEDYNGIIVPPGDQLFHLDGLHRLIAWLMNGRLDSDTEQTTAYIAGL